MEISIGSYKFRLEICILIVVVGWILFGHLLCSCCTLSLQEGMCALNNASTGGMSALFGGNKEGFSGANQGGIANIYSNADSPGYFQKPASWSKPALTYSPGTKPSAGVQSILDRPAQPVPVPNGQLDMFSTTEFKKECCPNAYSSSMGCACMTVEQYDYLHDRGGNNVPYSEY